MVTPFNSKAARYDYEYFSLYRVCGRVSRGVLRDGGRRFFYQCTPYLAWALIKLNPICRSDLLAVGLHDARRYTTRDATQFRDAWAPHTQTQRGTVCGDDDTPLHT